MVKTGIEVLQERNFRNLQGKRIGLLTNPAAVDSHLLSTYRIMQEAETVNLVALFAPEHGAFGRVQAGEKVDSSQDATTGIPIYSLYGDGYRPTAEMLAGLDVLVCDLQDIGARYYTYLWTLTHVIEACADVNLPVIVLDRPNPLGGDVIAGRGLKEHVASLVGRYDIPNQHGMTLGELALMTNAVWNDGKTQVEVIACENYQRNMTWEATGLPFVSPSPNIPTMTTVRHYIGSCLIEGTTLSEGRGTTLPFEIVGAPYIDGQRLADYLNNLGLAGVRFRPHQFTPLSSKHANEACGGVQAHITDASRYAAIPTWMHLIHSIQKLYPNDFAWLPAFDGGEILFFDKLIGHTIPREKLQEGASVREVMQGWQDYCEAFKKRRQPYLLYS